MKNSLFLLFILIFASISALASETGLSEHSFRTGGYERKYKLYIPESATAKAPLLVVLHGYGGSANPKRFGLNETADHHGFVVCYPEGLKNGKGKRGWNVGYPSQADMKVDDVKFVEALVRHLQKNFDVSKQNVFLTGHSNGGEMCYLVSLRKPKLFRAVASVSGLTMTWFFNRYNARRPINFMEIHGTEDRTSEWWGDADNNGGWGEYLAVPMAVSYWVAHDKCTRCERDTITPRTDTGHIINRYRFSEGRDNTQVWLYEIVGGHHSWGEKDIDTGEVIWEFFSQFCTK